eukprot:scaffold103703_cov60-Phaeocystis_antarctica.AAC.3
MASGRAAILQLSQTLPNLEHAARQNVSTMQDDTRSPSSPGSKNGLVGGGIKVEAGASLHTLAGGGR